MSKIGECERDPDINGSYGYRRICIWVKNYYGLQVNHKRIYLLMRRMGLQTKIRKKK
ncbi:IS3 family transposase [Bacillus wiedmannii]|uniref:IS3 family transposase n=1 Tax=Bacillus wiedmannii TaxID=1890302 RepID=UPI0034CDA1B3